MAENVERYRNLSTNGWIWDIYKKGSLGEFEASHRPLWCSECGVIILDTEVHNKWHERMTEQGVYGEDYVG